MKKLLLILMTIPVMCQAQEKGDNTLVVTSAISASKLKAALFQAGFMPQGSDSVIVLTSDKMIKYGSFLKLNILKTDDAVYIKGMMRLPEMSPILGDFSKEYIPIIYHPKENKYVAEAWQEMSKLATIIGGNVKYLKQ